MLAGKIEYVHAEYTLMRGRLSTAVSSLLLLPVLLFAAQTTAPITNQDVIELKRWGVGDEVVLMKIRTAPTNFKMETADIVALKTAGVSDTLIAEMLKPASNATPTSPNKVAILDLSKGAVVLPFGSSIKDPAAAGLPEGTKTAVINVLRSDGMLGAVGSQEESDGKKPWIEISANLVDFAGGNVATRMIIGLGTGRAHAGFSFTVKEISTGKVLWKKVVKETASFWSNSASSSGQRSELPEKVAKSFMEQLKKAKIKAQ
jgi:hypothetical protein